MDIFGSLFGQVPSPSNPMLEQQIAREQALNRKVTELRARGLSVRPAEGPISGLWEVSGHPELTTGQLLNL